MNAREMKVEIDRLRRVAKRRGMVVSKSRRRDPYALDYGLFAVSVVSTGLHLGGRKPDTDGGPYELTLAEVQKILGSGDT